MRSRASVYLLHATPGLACTYVLSCTWLGKVESDRWFYWADRLGLLVWQDMPAMTAGVNPSAEVRAQYEREMKQMIDEHISSPSVIMWVTFNEG